MDHATRHKQGIQMENGYFGIRRALTPLSFTGERMTGEAIGQIEFEHVHRYCFARDHAVGKRVLDCASGEGYGSFILASSASSVKGLEIDSVALGHAQAAFARDNLEYIQGDAQSLPFDDGVFDVVVSFETIEHVPRPDLVLREFKRVLAPGGLLIISTPDQPVYSPSGSEPNPYHLFEWTRSEFHTAIAEVFANQLLLEQRAMAGSVIAPVARPAAMRSYERRAEDVIEAGDGVLRAPYLIALASDGALPPVNSAVYIDKCDLQLLYEQARRFPEVDGMLEQVARDLENARRDIEAYKEAVDGLIQSRDQALEALEALKFAFLGEEQRQDDGEVLNENVLLELNREIEALKASLED